MLLSKRVAGAVLVVRREHHGNTLLGDVLFADIIDFLVENAAVQEAHIALKHAVSDAAAGNRLMFFHTHYSAKSPAKVRLFVGITNKSKKQSTYSEKLLIF